MGQLSFEGLAMQEDLKTRGYTLIDHHIPDDAIDELVATYAEFTDNHPTPEPATVVDIIEYREKKRLDDLARHKDTQKEWHKYRTNHPFIFKPGGYTNRSLQADSLRAHGLQVWDEKKQQYEYLIEDPKEFYHFLPSGLTLINQQHKEFEWGHVPPEVENLHSKFATIHNIASKAVTQTLGTFEDIYPDIHQILTPKDLNNSPLRLLFYHPGQGDELAGGHYDKDIFTWQLAESHEGLRVGNPTSGEMQNIIRDPEKAAVFMGNLITLEHIHPESPIQPGWHDVINVDRANKGRTLHGQNVARWALIYFTNSVLAGEVDKGLTHDRASIPIPQPNTEDIEEQVA